jgi:hypothetical protein
VFPTERHDRRVEVLVKLQFDLATLVRFSCLM